jgi:hypothetical protein
MAQTSSLQRPLQGCVDGDLGLDHLGEGQRIDPLRLLTRVAE